MVNRLRCYAYYYDDSDHSARELGLNKSLPQGLSLAQELGHHELPAPSILDSWEIQEAKPHSPGKLALGLAREARRACFGPTYL